MADNQYDVIIVGAGWFVSGSFLIWHTNQVDRLVWPHCRHHISPSRSWDQTSHPRRWQDHRWRLEP
jgi:hypothetical protein